MPGQPLDEPARLGALERTGLLDVATDPVLDRLTRLAARVIGAPVSLVFALLLNEPFPLRWLARGLPFGYGMQALADATLHDASIGALAPQLLPLAAFAVALPVAGTLAFGWIERAVRVRGELDLY